MGGGEIDFHRVRNGTQRSKLVPDSRSRMANWLSETPMDVHDAILRCKRQIYYTKEKETIHKYKGTSATIATTCNSHTRHNSATPTPHQSHFKPQQRHTSATPEPLQATTPRQCNLTFWVVSYSPTKLATAKERPNRMSEEREKPDREGRRGRGRRERCDGSRRLPRFKVSLYYCLGRERSMNTPQCFS